MDRASSPAPAPVAAPAPASAETAAGPRQDVDALVVGGGPAGLSCALYLARYDRSVVVLDDGSGRSTWPQVNHNYLGFPGGVAAAELRRLGREQLAAYPHVRLRSEEVVDLQGDLRVGFRATTASGARWCGRVVVLAGGVSDHFPTFEGWQSFVGRSMFWCLTCDGWESRGKDVLVLGDTDRAAGEALQLRALTDRVRLLTGRVPDRLSPEAQDRLGRLGVPVVRDEVVSVLGTDGQLEHVVTASGTELPLEVLFSVQGATPRSALAAALDLARTDDGYVRVDSEQATSVPGVYAAGDLTAHHSHQVSAAVHEGAQAASAANHALHPPELRVG